MDPVRGCVAGLGLKLGVAWADAPRVDDGHGGEQVGLVARAALHGANVVGADEEHRHARRRVRQLAVAQAPVQVVDLVVCRGTPRRPSSASPLATPQQLLRKRPPWLASSARTLGPDWTGLARGAHTGAGDLLGGAVHSWHPGLAWGFKDARALRPSACQPMGCAKAGRQTASPSGHTAATYRASRLAKAEAMLHHLSHACGHTFGLESTGRTADAQRVCAVLARPVLLEHWPVAALAHVLRDRVAEEDQLKALRRRPA